MFQVMLKEKMLYIKKKRDLDTVKPEENI